MEKEVENPKQEQIHDLIFSREIGWQEILYDLINTEQLDPWDIDISLLAEKYLLRVRQLEEADFFISSKVLLAASLLLRLKSEFLLNKYIKSIDEVLFGKKEPKRKEETIELEEEIPALIPRTPLPRHKKISLQELVEALNKAIATENRRIKREILNRNALREAGISIPKRRFSIKNKIKEIYSRLFKHFKENKDLKKISYTEFVGPGKEERALSFFPLLELENQQKIWLEQEKHFDEIFIWLKETFLKHNPDPFADLKKAIEEKKEFDEKEQKRAKKAAKNFENPLAHLFE